MKFYILKLDGSIVSTEDVLERGAWFENGEARVIGNDHPTPEIHVSTIFTGLDLGILEGPLLFETMIFGGELDRYRERYATYEEAREGHSTALLKVLETLRTRRK